MRWVLSSVESSSSSVYPGLLFPTIPTFPAPSLVGIPYPFLPCLPFPPPFPFPHHPYLLTPSLPPIIPTYSHHPYLFPPSLPFPHHPYLSPTIPIFSHHPYLSSSLPLPSQNQWWASDPPLHAHVFGRRFGLRWSRDQSLLPRRSPAIPRWRQDVPIPGEDAARIHHQLQRAFRTSQLRRRRTIHHQERQKVARRTKDVEEG